MKLPFADPDPDGSERARAAKAKRDLATEIARLRPAALTRTNGEEADHDNAGFPANFTKGLKHNDVGIVDKAVHYRCFVEAINSSDRTVFEKRVTPSGVTFKCQLPKGKLKWRGWESPRAGHVYELEGADAASVGMAPAPRVGSSELAAEMAEVYGLALLRDVPFTEICAGGGKKLCASEKSHGTAVLNAQEVVDCLNAMPFYKGGPNLKSSTPAHVDGSGHNEFERNRRHARTSSLGDALTTPLTTDVAFRGSTPGAQVGPYISQFMLVGAPSIAGASAGTPAAKDAAFGIQDGYIPYGSIVIDQRTITHKNCLDYMTDWASWLDVQNGANFKGTDVYEEKRRFITTPRDLVTYVHFDALYEAYLNACLIMLGLGIPASKGFPEPSPTRHRDSFATFGGPHILSLVTEVATRCLKAVRRQKFNFHRRARPEVMGGRFSLVKLKLHKKLGCAAGAFKDSLGDIHDKLLKAVAEHNKNQNTPGMQNMRTFTCPDTRPHNVAVSTFQQSNLLLPMAFPEGSPMHPAYGAGHATVAGGCVTMLKAFFEMFEDCDGGQERKLVDKDGKPIRCVPDAKGNKLVPDPKGKDALTVQGELDKLAANISIGRNMAGVHYYSDYYDSLRMGERIAVSILLEQAPTYGDYVECTFTSFDGDHVTIAGEAGACPMLSVMDRDGNVVSPRDWWLRHVSGEQFREDI